MAFAQVNYRESLRDIEACLRWVGGKLYHMGFRGKVARSTLADANESRDWRIYADFAQVLIAIARPLYVHDPIGVDLDQTLYALDSTTDRKSTRLNSSHQIISYAVFCLKKKKKKAHKPTCARVPRITAHHPRHHMPY